MVEALVVIPVFDHAGTLRAVAQGCLDQGLQVLVVDDGSTDGALEAVAGLPLRTHRVPVNRGKGAAILAGAALARDWGFEAILTIDADGQHDPAEAGALLAGADWPCIVVGARRMDGPGIPGSSRFGRAFSNFWVRLECGQALPDTQSGFRLYPVDFLLDTRFLTRRYTFEVEVLVRAVWAGLAVLSVPVSVDYPTGDARVTHFRALRDNLRFTALNTFLMIRSLLPWPRRPRPSRPSGSFFRNLVREHASPPELAMAVGVGIFLGSLPIIPFGLAVIVYVCHRLRLNKLAAAGASNLCVVPFVPFLCIETGHLLLHGRFWADFTRQGLVKDVHLRLLEWLVGSLVLGPVLGLAGALGTYGLVKALRAK